MAFFATIFRGNVRGFTVVDLLLNVSVLGAITAAAVPLIERYRESTFDTQSSDDLKHAATAEEAYFHQNLMYADCIGTPSCEDVLPGFHASEGTNISMFQVPGGDTTPQYFIGHSWHRKGKHDSTGNAIHWNSNLGGLQ